MTTSNPIVRGQYVMIWRAQKNPRRDDMKSTLIRHIQQTCLTGKTRLETHAIEWPAALNRMVRVAEAFSGRPVQLSTEEPIGPYNALAFKLMSTNESSTDLLELCRHVYRECAAITGQIDGLLLDELSTGLIPLRCGHPPDWPPFDRLIQIHPVQDAKALNLHTHGLVKFARPDIEVMCPIDTDIALVANRLVALAQKSLQQKPLKPEQALPDRIEGYQVRVCSVLTYRDEVDDEVAAECLPITPPPAATTQLGTTSGVRVRKGYFYDP